MRGTRQFKLDNIHQQDDHEIPSHSTIPFSISSLFNQYQLQTQSDVYLEVILQKHYLTATNYEDLYSFESLYQTKNGRHTIA